MRDSGSAGLGSWRTGFLSGFPVPSPVLKRNIRSPVIFVDICVPDGVLNYLSVSLEDERGGRPLRRYEI